MELGRHLAVARRAVRVTQRAVAERVGISQSTYSRIERGLGTRVPLETWVALGTALDQPLAVAYSRPLGASHAETADAGHLLIQEHVLALARQTGRHGTFELPTRPSDPTGSTDVGIRDARHATRILAECWNTFGDLGAAARATHRKAAEASAAWPDGRIATVWVVRASATNRALLARYPYIVEAAFPGSSRRWVRAIEVGDQPPPEGPGIVWFEPSTGRLTEHRRATIAG
ncbi:MAG: helix-turn-helix transcriptional regulator [Candidatus Limnocylindrales bacterium]